jgi:Fimbrial assembly protein (PilN)
MSQQINLYAPIFRKQSKVFSAATMVQGLALMVVVVGVFFWTIAAHTSLLEIRAADSARQLQGELERLKAYGVGATPAERARLLAERKKTLEASLAGQTQALQVFGGGALGRTEGYSELLRALARRSMKGVWLTRIEFAEASGELSLSGRATRAELVPAYLERLRGEPALRGQAFSRLEVMHPAKMPYVEFTLSSGERQESK